MILSLDDLRTVCHELTLTAMGQSFPSFCVVTNEFHLFSEGFLDYMHLSLDTEI